jgi:hypothetical protein
VNAASSAGAHTGRKLAGYTLSCFLDSNDDSEWYDAEADNGERVIVYVYQNQADRDRSKFRLHGFRTTSDEYLLDIRHRLYISIGDHRLMMPKALRDALRSTTTRPTEIENYEIDQVLGHGYKGITYKVQQRHGPRTPYALKLTLGEEYAEKTPLPEVDQMVDLASHDRDHFPQIHRWGEYLFEQPNKTYRLVYFIEDFIQGKTLEYALKHAPESLDPVFLYRFTSEMLAALATMQTRRLMHDDLHAGNVILHEPLSGLRRPYLIDFGSTKPLANTKKPRDDIRNLASQIAAICNVVQQHKNARTAYEDRILDATEALLASISDDDPLRRPDDARELLHRFNRGFGQGVLRQELKHPFDFGNAEEVMDNGLLYSLSAKSFPWRNQIEESSHLLVIGPRGSGKTTVFRSMSFKCLCDAKRSDDAISRPYIGLYISCTKEFRQRFSAIAPDLLVRRQDDIRHYFHLIVMREFITSLAACSNLLDADIQALCAFIRQHTAILDNEPPGATLDVAAIEAKVTREVNESRMGLWTDSDVRKLTPQGFLADIANLASSSIGPFIGKTLYLFVDDYTERKVPKEAQRALNHILFVPNSAYKCKISSEVFGVTLDETFGNFLAQDRDYREWNLGTLYCLNLPTKDQKEFLREIVNTRLLLCGFQGTVDTIIGSSDYSCSTLARTLKREAECRREKRRHKSRAPSELVEREVQREIDSADVAANYHGWDTICELCTGDVSNILELLNRMYDDCGVKADSTTLLTPQQQNSVIEGYSRQYIAKIKGIPKYGERLFTIVDAFGNMAKRLLEDHPGIQRTPQRKDPYQLIRIELDEAGNSNPNEEADEIWRLLQRYCIFVDAEESRSRRNTLSSRVILRRIFCPAFRIGLANSESWTISRDQWKAFCNGPQERAERFVDGVLSRRGVGDDSQGKLFEI